MDIIRDLQNKGIELIPAGDNLKVRGKLTDEDRQKILEHKAEILAILTAGQCEKCKAAGYWDYSHYAGKLLCFHYAVYEGRSGRPVPCDEARLNCPKTANKKNSNGTKDGTT